MTPFPDRARTNDALKLGVVLDQPLAIGGGFQQSINAVAQIGRICPPWLTIELFTTIRANAAHPALSGMTMHVVRGGVADDARHTLLSSHLPKAASRLVRRLGINTSLERALRARGVDLVYFVSPSRYALSLRCTPYVLTVWDLCHRDHPEFPEVSDAGEFVRRETYYRQAINRSFLTLCDSDALGEHIARRYGTDRDRLLAMPFQPAWFTRATPAIPAPTSTRQAGLPPNYLFYPAQFWPHKNHIRILQALEALKERNRRVQAVFCGSDRGNRAYLERAAEALGVRDQLTFTGFVDEQAMRDLYLGSRALVMPTYFGPTNIPPLEAWALERPVICSNASRDQVQDAALCFDPDSASELADAIERVYDDRPLVDTLVANGRKRLQALESDRTAAEATLLARLGAFRVRRSCWGER